VLITGTKRWEAALYPLRRKREAKSDRRPALSLPTLLLHFLQIGTIGFGGGMAVIALMERDLVQKKHALEADEFLHGIALGQVLGPFAVNAALFVGNRLYGPLGGLACAAAFLAPSILIVITLSWLYFSFHAIPAMQSAIGGLGPVVIALILSAAWSMGKKAVRSYPSVLIALLALAVSLLKINAVYILLGAGLTGLIAGKWIGARGRAQGPKNPGKQGKPGRGRSSSAGLAFLPVSGIVSGGMSIASIAWVFLKAGCVFFGGGFVLVPVLHQKLVEHLGWLSQKEFIDGVAISNLTPGPLAVLATFTGFHLHGVSGALVATIALFTPALILMTVLSQGYSRLKEGRRLQDFLTGVTPAVVGMVVSAAVLLAPGAVHGTVGWVLAGVSLFLLVMLRWHPAWVLAIGAILGVVGVVA
jgi:chromate transporter